MVSQDDNPYNDVTASSGVPFNSPLIYLPTKRYQAWRFLSYMFIHNGYVHLIFNCVLQLALGALLELVHKFWRVGIVYLLGVIAGKLIGPLICSWHDSLQSPRSCHLLKSFPLPYAINQTRFFIA